MRSTSHMSSEGGAVVPRSDRVDNGIIPNSFRSLSGYLRIVSSGASTMASTVRSAASAMVEREDESNHDQVLWAGFDKLEVEKDVTRKVLLLAFSSGFQVWDVEVADDVCKLVSRYDGAVSFMQMLPRPVVSGDYRDNFAESHPLLIICANASFSGGGDIHEVNDPYMPTVVWFYSLRSQSYVHLLRFRSAVLVVRSSSRMVVVLQSAQIHCVNAATLEREYTILTNPVPAGCVGSGYIGCGPLAVGPRWMAYSGRPVLVSSSGCVISQHLTTSSSFPSLASNGSLVAHYAKESTKHLAAGIVTLGDMGFKRLSRYYSERLPEGKNCRTGIACTKVQGVANGHSMDAESVGMVIVRDISSKTVIAQFQAHKSPILSLCFDPSGVLLVTASVQGHNINVFHIAPGLFGGSNTDSGRSYVHLYRLQRGLTNAVIRDISFSSDSRWIMASSSRGTSHLFVISPPGGLGSAMHWSTNSTLQMVMQRHITSSGPPVTLSAVSRIRNGSNGWKNTMTGAAAAATGRSTSLPAAAVSAFHSCEADDNRDYYLLVLSQSGSLVQYALRISPADDGSESNPPDDVGVTVEAIRKWNIRQRENGDTHNSKVYPERLKSENDAVSDILFATSKEFTPEERRQMHISEAELQMHENRNLLWARSEIYLQSMLVEGINIDDDERGGEIEIEKVPIQSVEVRSKGLVPVFDYLKFENRSNAACHNSSGCSLRSTADVVARPADTDSETVNDREKFGRENQPSFIHNEKMENGFVDDDESE